MRNYDISPDSSKRCDSAENDEASEERWETSDGAGGENSVGPRVEGCAEELEKMNLQIFGDLPPEALKYIQQLELELSTAKKVSSFYLWFWNLLLTFVCWGLFSDRRMC